MERKLYSNELAGIKQLTLEMGQKTVDAVRFATQALISNDADIAGKARSLEKEVDVLYRQIDDRCIVSIATQQPMAGDLRFLVSTLKIATEIERIADYANNIAKMVQRKFCSEDMSPTESLKPAVDIMSREAISMLTEALTAYEKNDADLAMLVPQRDALVNRLNKDLFRNILAMATVKKYANELAMDFHTAVRYIERVADRSGNIAEYVYYAVTGYRFPDNKK
ncbi:MAG: phosphate signaling complex protein PhoU [Negativicutes bacterium]|nr:phosphate signaling complex protein PhoU [Negativicutes bacterium]